MSKHTDLIRTTIKNTFLLDRFYMGKAIDRLCYRHWDMGAEMLLQYFDATGDMSFAPPKTAVVIAAADHGVAGMGVSAYKPSVTREMLANYLISRGAAANAFANFAAADLIAVDVGVAADTDDLPNLRKAKIAWGTHNITEGPAMSREEAEESVAIGIQTAKDLCCQGYNIFLPGEMGIGNTTSAAALCSALCQLPPDTVTGHGTNISDAQWQKKVKLIRQALEVSQPDPSDCLDILAKVGGFEFGFMAGLILGATAGKVLVVLDGFNTAVSAFIAYKLNHLVTAHLMASQLADIPGHKAMLDGMRLFPTLHLDLKLSEGGGSSLAVSILSAFMAMARCDYMDNEISEDGQSTLMRNLTASIRKDSRYVATRRMNRKHRPVTDRTFDFYFHTMPEPDRLSMQACRHRLDHLSKPVDSLGALEDIAVELAGITSEERPSLRQRFTLLAFAAPNVNQPSEYFMALAHNVEANVLLAKLTESGASLTAYFDYGRYVAEDISFDTPLVGMALLTNDPPATAAQLREALLNPDGSLRYAGDEFLAHVPATLQNETAAIVGAIIAAAHNSSMIIVDGGATKIIARYTAELLPAVRPYILHTAGSLLRLGELPPGFYAFLGRKIVDASMYVLNDMKTFAETSVSPACAGAGVIRQS